MTNKYVYTYAYSYSLGSDEQLKCLKVWKAGPSQGVYPGSEEMFRTWGIQFKGVGRGPTVEKRSTL